MVDLEDAILKKNVPGRYSSWADEDDDKHRRRGGNDGDGDDDSDGGAGGSARGNDNDDVGDDDDDSKGDEYYFDGLPTGNDAARQTTTTPRLRPSGGNTGVKGVIADHREHLRRERLTREEERLEGMRILQRAVRPAVRAGSDAAAAVKRGANRGGDGGGDESDFDDDDDGEDDEFMKRYRKGRLAQLRQQSAAVPQSTESESSQNRKLPPLPTFGTVTTVTPEEYAELVDALHPQAYLIVHLHESSIRQCRMLHSALERVAQCADRARFVEVSALDANPNLDTICLPVLLIYRGGELVHNLTRFVERELPSEQFGAEDVRIALEEYIG